MRMRPGSTGKDDAMNRFNPLTATFLVALGLLFFTAGMMVSCAAPRAGRTEAVDGQRLDGIDVNGPMRSLTILEPADGSVYPIDLAPPLFQWRGSGAGRWLVTINATEETPAQHFCIAANPWVPTPSDWERIKAISPGSPLSMTVMRIEGRRAVAAGTVHFSVSPVPMACRVVYQELPVPFGFAEKHVDQFRWRSFSPEAVEPPDTVLTKLPYCGNCHIFSRDGSVFGLDVDYRGDRGGYVLTDVSRNMRLRKRDVISWNDHLPGVGGVSRGLFAKISPSGEYVVATVKERPLLVRINDPAYSQLFFPLSGYLAYYSRLTGTIRPLRGANDPTVVQTSPAWSPDGRTIVFARGRPPAGLVEELGQTTLLDAAPGEDIASLNQQYRMRFDLWQVPFADGAGGAAAPLTGASDNGKSNYFARYSPDGRWIVFCQSDTGLVSQPGSRLMIMSAGGGEPREMVCNRPELNSWHSFSPNGRWMVFSSKPDGSCLTRVYLTRIDEQGRDAPAVRLHRIGTPGFAAILPEAVGLANNAFRQVRLVEP
jgi:hypothetical protein